ncbi:ATP-dependent DNA helicase [Solimonas sp. K1W22B-7]|uniref:ATP-dependent DNA helicase n=1 Tax=Solimonas sp. K1W22B-7 TaxID=2303331 RepID=UPI000E3357F6|nr:ATP-dependent DNA helicase [Solimonas sp. K1W22B-7]AXQ29072.1 ATP-dependent DNA helicase [Solimonas sp. K1W22B-7]
MDDSAAALLGAEGPLAASVPQFTPRLPQQEMAQAVELALRREETLVVEAGTGTGKTYAYLVPVLMSGRRVAISTGTKTLQDQLFHRDLPRVRDALGLPVRVALLKGRGNYLCLYRMKRARLVPALKFLFLRLREVEDWARRTQTGEISELGSLDGEEMLVRQITSTSDNCVGSRCPDFDQCHVARARRNAQAADVVVINHHLLFADFVLKEEGFGQILAGTDAIVVDEAHQLPELAAQFFGQRLSTRQLQELAKDTQTEADNLGDMPQLREAAEALAAASVRFENAFSGPMNRITLDEFLSRPLTRELCATVGDALQALFEAVKPFEERNAELAGCVTRADDLLRRYGHITAGIDPGQVRWAEPAQRGGSLHSTPILVADGFRRMLETYPGAWVLTSATLATSDGFGHFTRELGLEQARSLQLDSPFDFEAQARLYLPRGLPEPNHPEYPEAVVTAALPVIDASRGGVFVLCTSHRALKRIAAGLRARLQLPIFVQGEDSRSALLDAFTQDGNAVLVGTSSFWEGVDVKGQALRVVIIDKLPFTAPGDPVYEAKLEAIRRAGGKPFFDLQLPEAIVMLRQGVGRLIRDAEDRGLLMLCDPRLRSKGYGRQVLASLPRMPQLENLGEVRDWMEEIAI